MRPTIPATLLLAVSCAGGNTPSPAPEPGPPPRIAYAPATARYAAVSHRHVEQEISGQTTANTIVTRYVLRTEIQPPADAGMPVTMVLDSLTIEGQAGISQAEIAAAQGSRFSAILRPGGTLREFTGGDTTRSLVRQIASTLRHFFPRIPPAGAEPGGRWTDTTESATDVGGVVITMHTVATHEVLDWDSRGGSRSLPIRTDATYTLTGTGMQAGQTLTLEGSGTRHMLRYLSGDGVYVGGLAADTSRFEVLLTQMGITIPGRQWSADTIVALR